MVVGDGASLTFTGTGTITASELTCTGCVANSELVNDSITFAGDSGSNASALGTTFNIVGAGIATTSVSTNTLTVTATEADTLSSVTGRGASTSDLVTLTGGLITQGAITGKALVIFDETGDQDIFTASSSGVSKFVIDHDGKVGIGVTNPSSTLEVSGTLTSSGGIVNLNASSNYATNINTGTSTGALSLGGGLGTVAVDSTTWDVSTAGIASGLTGITSSGTITLSGLTASRAVFTDASSNLVSTATSSYLLDSLSDETGTGVAVFGTSPIFTTDITTPSILSSADLTINPHIDK